jgi:hypothetical protein
MLPVSVIILFAFGIVATMWYFLFLISFYIFYYLLPRWLRTLDLHFYITIKHREIIYIQKGKNLIGPNMLSWIAVETVSILFNIFVNVIEK